MLIWSPRYFVQSILTQAEGQSVVFLHVFQELLYGQPVNMARFLALVGDNINGVSHNTTGLVLPLPGNFPLLDAYYQVHKLIMTITELVEE